MKVAQELAKRPNEAAIRKWLDNPEEFFNLLSHVEEQLKVRFSAE